MPRSFILYALADTVHAYKRETGVNLLEIVIPKDHYLQMVEELRETNQNQEAPESFIWDGMKISYR